MIVFMLRKDAPPSLISPLPDSGFYAQKERAEKYEIFGFAPYWNLHKLNNVDFNTLTTLAYFGIAVDSEGSFAQDDPGYAGFHSQTASELFQKAHDYGTKVVLTLTQMDNETIEQFLDNPAGQQNAINNALQLVRERNIEGINIDFEYIGNPREDQRQKFTDFVGNMSEAMKTQGHTTSISVYAASARQPKMYDINSLAKKTDQIFMMAYDYATTATDSAIPTAPLYGHREGKYWYDVSSAVDDFLSQMPAEKLILGTPWYGYNLLVYEPEVNAETRPWYSWRGKPSAQTFGQIQDSIRPDMPGISDFREGWDDLGKSRWRAYYVAATDTWRMVFYDDIESMRIKYDFAKTKKLAGVGVWALGFDEGRRELWDVLAEKFGSKNHDSRISQKQINENI